MSNNILLIHETWGNSTQWEAFSCAMKSRGFQVYAPDLPFHLNPHDYDFWINAQNVAEMSLKDYVNDLEKIIDSMNDAPVIVGYGMGAIAAQLLATRCQNRGLILLAPAPSSGLLYINTDMVKLWGRFVFHWLFNRPMYPVSWNVWIKYIGNAQTEEIQKQQYSYLCAESGRVFFEIMFWFLDPNKCAEIDYSQTISPVLILTGSEDKCFPAKIGKNVALKYQDLATYVELEGLDHLMIHGDSLPKTLDAIDHWLSHHYLRDFLPETI